MTMTIVKNMGGMMRGLMNTSQIGSDGIDGSGYEPKDVTNTAMSSYPNCTNLTYGPMLVDGLTNGYGINLGSGTTAVTTDDYKLDTPIANGVGAGQLDYGVMTHASIIDTGSAYKIIFSRVITNLSGGDVTVREVGFIPQCYVSSVRYIMVAREVLASPVTIAHTEAYVFSIAITIPYAPYTKAFCYWLIGTWLNANQTVKDTSNADRSVGNPSNTTYPYGFALGPAGNTNYGMLAGQGTTAETKDDYAMETLIAHGTGAGQLEYGETSHGAHFDDGGKLSWYVNRIVTNNSGGNVTINEVGLVAEISTSSTIYYFLLARKKLASGLVLADTESATIRCKLPF